MTVEELKAIQNISKAGNRSIWFSPKDPQFWMLKKTVFKQLCKLLPKNLNMSKIVSYDNIVEGGGTMRLDEENNPIVVEGVKLTRADKFQAAMQEDEDIESLLPGLDPEIKSANIHLAEVVDTKTEKVYTKEEVKKIKSNFKKEKDE